MDQDKQPKEFPEEDDFPYHVLWNDIEESGFEKFVPWISLIILFVVLIILMIKK